MQATKIIFSVLLGILAFAMSSCSSTEYRPTDGDCKFVIKKVDGKRQWGMVDSRNMQVEYIPCQYDSIFSVYDAPYNIKDLFVAVKDGKMYAWTYRGKQLLGGKGFTSLVSSEQKAQHNKSVYGGALFHEVQTSDGIMFFYLPLSEIDWVEFGPAECILWGNKTILYKKNEKWGILIRKNFSEITPCIYESVINVGETYFWVKKDGKWFAIDRDNKPIRKPTYLLDKYLKLQSMSGKQFQKEENTALFRKISIEEASYITVNPWRAKYISW